MLRTFVLYSHALQLFFFSFLSFCFCISVSSRGNLRNHFVLPNCAVGTLSVLQCKSDVAPVTFVSPATASVAHAMLPTSNPSAPQCTAVLLASTVPCIQRKKDLASHYLIWAEQPAVIEEEQWLVQDKDSDTQGLLFLSCHWHFFPQELLYIFWAFWVIHRRFCFATFTQRVLTASVTVT